MSFTIDHENTSTGGLVPIGTYECVIKAAFEDVTPNGAAYINVPLIIRNDVGQPYKNTHIWHSIWRKKEPNKLDTACGGYNAAQVNALGKAAAIPNGKSYGSLDELFADLQGKPVKVKVKHEEYNGKTHARVDTIDVSVSLPCEHVFKTPPAVNTVAFAAVTEVIDDDDLPF